MKKILVYSTAFLMTLIAQAGKVTPKIALQKAQAFMPHQARNLRLVAHGEGKNPAWYAFSSANSQHGGFVIMAGDDRVSQVLGYSDEGTFDADNMPENIKWWLKGCEEQIELLRQGKAQATRVGESRPAVAPMVTSKWGQRAPYNLQTPEVDGTHTPTGCMPTAMAQILYYWKSKAGASAIDAYTTSTKGIEVDALPATTFNYDIMQDEYEMDDSSESALEVAKLMRYCGQAFNVDYDEEGSGAGGGCSNFVDNFHFDIHGFDLRSISESRDNWNDVLYEELAAGRPIFMSGVNYIVGHGFVVDGYDGHGFYHINWGWNGKDNGFYLLEVACPGDTEDVTIYGEGYSIGQIATIGLRPASDDITYDDMALCVSSIETDAEVYTRSSTEEDFSIEVSAQVNNYYGATLSFEHTVAVYTSDGNFVKIGNVRSSELQPMYGGEYPRYVDFGSGIESGTYILKMVSRLEGQETWNPDFGSYRHYVELTVDGNEMRTVTVTNPFTKSFTINSMEVVGKSKVGRELSLKFNATNTGTYYINALYVVIDGDIASAIGVPFSPGETGDFFIRYTPTTPGSKTIQIRTARYNAATTIWSGTFDVAVPSEPNLTLEEVAVDGADTDNMELGVEIWKVLIDVRNNASEIYDGVLRTMLYKYNEATGWYNSQGSVLSDVEIPAGETAHVEVSLDALELEVGATYFSRISVYRPSTGKYETLTDTPEYTVVDKSTGIAILSEGSDRLPVPIYNVSGQRVDATDSQNLPSGLYIVGGKKFLQR